MERFFEKKSGDRYNFILFELFRGDFSTEKQIKIETINFFVGWKTVCFTSFTFCKSTEFVAVFDPRKTVQILKYR